MSISPRTTTYQGASNPGWLASAHGIDSAGSGTLDISKFDKETHYPLGFIRGGTRLAKVAATKLYGPYTPGDATLGTFHGFLLWDTPVNGTKEPAAIHDHGKVHEARLPFPVDAAGKTAVGSRIQFV